MKAVDTSIIKVVKTESPLAGGEEFVSTPIQVDGLSRGNVHCGVSVKTDVDGRYVIEGSEDTDNWNVLQDQTYRAGSAQRSELFLSEGDLSNEGVSYLRFKFLNDTSTDQTKLIFVAVLL